MCLPALLPRGNAKHRLRAFDADDHSGRGRLGQPFQILRAHI
jgi:hypothetical protein